MSAGSRITELRDLLGELVPFLAHRPGCRPIADHEHCDCGRNALRMKAKRLGNTNPGCPGRPNAAAYDRKTPHPKHSASFDPAKWRSV